MIYINNSFIKYVLLAIACIFVCIFFAKNLLVVDVSDVYIKGGMDALLDDKNQNIDIASQLATTGVQKPIIVYKKQNKDKDLNLLVKHTNKIYSNNFDKNEVLQVNISTTFNEYLTNDTKLEMRYDSKSHKLLFNLPAQKLIGGNAYTNMRDVLIGSLGVIDDAKLVKMNKNTFFIDNKDIAKQYITLKDLISSKFTFYKLKTDNLFSNSDNSSFVGGLWTNKVIDCSGWMDGEAGIAMQYISPSILQLSSTNHYACARNGFALNITDKLDRDVYVITTRYNTIQGDGADAHVKFYTTTNNSESTLINLPKTNGDWDTYKQELDVPEYTKEATVHLYAKSDGSANSVNQFDYIKLSKYTQVDAKTIPVVQLAHGVHDVIVREDGIYLNHGFSNLAWFNQYNMLPSKEASFEDATHDPIIEDCSKWMSGESNSLVAKITNDASQGNSSLKLSSEHHYACTHNSFDFVSDANTANTFSFDYKNIDGGKIKYYIKTCDGETFAKEMSIDNKDWNTEEYNFNVDLSGKCSTTIYFYSQADNMKVTNLIDNLQIYKKAPLSLSNQFLSQDMSNKIDENVVLDSIKDKVVLNNLKKGVFIILDDAYNKNLFIKDINQKRHYKINNYGNAWWVDVDTLCKGGNESKVKSAKSKVTDMCTQNADGTYNIELIIEHKFNKYLSVALLISGTTFITLIGYFGYDTIKRRRNKILKKKVDNKKI